VSLKLYDILGRELKVLDSGEKLAGSYELNLSGKDLSAGVYFVSLSAGKDTETKKIVLLK